MDHPEGDRGQRLDHEVAVAHRVERVRGHAVEAELARPSPRGRADSRRPASAPGPERRHVQPAARIGQPAAVALDHLDVREQVMGEEDRLGGLDMRRARAGRPSPSRSASPTSARSKSSERRVEPIDRAPRPQAQVRRDLVVARAAGVELAGQRPDPVGERRLEVEVDVLERRVPVEPARRRRRRRGRPGRRRARRPRRRSAARPGRGRGRGRSSPRGRRRRARASTSIERVKSATRASSRFAEPTAPDPHRPSVVRRTCYRRGRVSARSFPLRPDTSR